MSVFRHMMNKTKRSLELIEDVRYPIYSADDTANVADTPKQKLKPLIITLLCITVLIALCIAGGIKLYHSYTYGIHQHKIDDVKKYEAHFESLAERLYSIYEEKNELTEDCVCLYVFPLSDTFGVEYVYSPPREKIYGDSFDMSDSEKESAVVLNGLFADGSSDGIYRIIVSSEQIAFCNTSGYAVVLRTDSDEPTFIDPTSHSKIYSQKIADGWYHSIEIPDRQ